MIKINTVDQKNRMQESNIFKYNTIEQIDRKREKTLI